MRPRPRNTFAKLAVVGGCLAALTAGGTALAETPSDASGGAVFVPPPAPPKRAVIVDGRAIAPTSAPTRVKRVIEAANRLVEKPYRYGGGHRLPWKLDKGYDCSGTVSWALHGGGLLKRPLDSSSFLRWGQAGPGQWITVYTRSSHAFVVIAGLRLDTSAAGDPSGLKGPRWRPTLRSTRGFKARHPAGL